MGPSFLAAGMNPGPTLLTLPMKIEAVTLRELRLPLVHFFETSFGRTYDRRIMLITVHAEGLNAWAECVAGEDPFYSDETIETAWFVLTKYLIPAVLSQSIERGQECVPRFAKVRGHRMAKGALENAVWDMEAQQR